MITMGDYDPRKAGLDTLLLLNGYRAEIGGGFWVAISVSQVPPETGRPHGIQYGLTLHRPGGARVLGYDNAHAVDVRSGPGNRSARPAAFDHAHRGERVVPYDFRSPGDLLEDFWRDVETILRKEGIR
jgi:hypothetical protein